MQHQHVRIIGALVRFIRDLVSDQGFDYIVPIERKGTALIRSSLSSADISQWRRVVSSTALETIFSEKKDRLKILLFDDSVWKGRSVTAVRKQLMDAAE